MSGWDRLLWGVLFTSGTHDTPLLIGTAWDNDRARATPTTEPTRTLLFRSRREARVWCQQAEKRAAKHSTGWRFMAARVRETVAPECARKATP